MKQILNGLQCILKFVHFAKNQLKDPLAVINYIANHQEDVDKHFVMFAVIHGNLIIETTLNVVNIFHQLIILKKRKNY